MSFKELPDDVQKTAARVLTDKQLQVWILHLGGVSNRDIAYGLGYSRSNVRDHLDAAHRKLWMNGVTQSLDGEWRVNDDEPEAA